MNLPKHIEERFDERFGILLSKLENLYGGNTKIPTFSEVLKSFIAQILEEEKERLVGEIEKMMNEHRMRECPMKGRMSQCTKDMCFHWTPSWESIITLIKK